jgi:hypothetical protein
MVSFLFWNLNKAAIAHRVARLASRLDVDVLILAECAIDPADMLQALNGTDGPLYCFPPSPSQKLHFFTTFSAAATIEVFNDPTGGLSIRKLLIGRDPGILLAAVHFPSRVNWEAIDQTLEATTLAHDILQAEDRVGHHRTILVGDLNMNPFDAGVAGATALHAVMTRDLARRGEREVRGKRYPFFYNPMWGHFGDRTAGPPGSYYLRASKPLNYYWNTYDQVLLRPELMDGFLDVRILDSDGQEPLVTSHGLPREADGSDHLPIFFRLNL